MKNTVRTLVLNSNRKLNQQSIRTTQLINNSFSDNFNMSKVSNHSYQQPSDRNSTFRNITLSSFSSIHTFNQSTSKQPQQPILKHQTTSSNLNDNQRECSALDQLDEMIQSTLSDDQSSELDPSKFKELFLKNSISLNNLQHSKQQPFKEKQLNDDDKLLRVMIVGSILLNDIKSSNSIIQNFYSSSHQRVLSRDLDLCYDLFRASGKVGTGMGLMRRLINQLFNNHRMIKSNQFKSSDHHLKLTLILEVHIQNLIRWGNLERAWNFLRTFKFDKTHLNLDHSLYQIGGKFEETVNRLKPLYSTAVWNPPSIRTYSNLISIYLLLGRPDLALSLGSVASLNLRSDDSCLALLVSAQSLVTTTRKDDEPDEQFFSEFNSLNLASVGPMTRSVILKLVCRNQGQSQALNLLNNLQPNHPRNRIILIDTWIDELVINLDKDREDTSKIIVTPFKVSKLLIDEIELMRDLRICEREFENYLRYTRCWLEYELRDRILFENYQNNCYSVTTTSSPQKLFLHSDNSSNNNNNSSITTNQSTSELSIDVNDPRLGYSNLKTLMASIYHSSDSGCLRPSSTVVSELMRIESMIGCTTDRLTSLLEHSIKIYGMGVRSSHMVGLIWSKIVNQDIVGLMRLVEFDMRFRYRVVLTGFLIGLILAGLVTIRAPKPVILNFSQRLIEQCPTKSDDHRNSRRSRSSRFMTEEDWRKKSLEASPKSYVEAVRAAASVGDLWLVRELHKEIVDRYGQENFYKDEAFSPDYLALIVESLMKLNEPLEAQREALIALKKDNRWILKSTAKSANNSDDDEDEGEEIGRVSREDEDLMRREQSFLSVGTVRDYLRTKEQNQSISSNNDRLLMETIMQIGEENRRLQESYKVEGRMREIIDLRETLKRTNQRLKKKSDCLRSLIDKQFQQNRKSFKTDQNDDDDDDDDKQIFTKSYKNFKLEEEEEVKILLNEWEFKKVLEIKKRIEKIEEAIQISDQLIDNLKSRGIKF